MAYDEFGHPLASVPGGEAVFSAVRPIDMRGQDFRRVGGLSLSAAPLITSLSDQTLDVARHVLIPVKVLSGAIISKITTEAEGSPLVVIQNLAAAPLTIAHNTKRIVLATNLAATLEQGDTILLLRSSDGIWYELGKAFDVADVGTAIANEATARIAATSALSDALSDEVVARIEADSAINELIEDLDLDAVPDTATRTAFLPAERTKLSGIEAAADVTDAANVAAAIAGVPAKVAPADADSLALIDSAAANVAKRLTWGDLKNRMWLAFGALLAAGSEKVTLADADVFALSDSAASSASKRVSWTTIKSRLWVAWGALVAAGNSKVSPADADAFAMSNSEASNNTVRLTWANAKAAMQAALNVVFQRRTIVSPHVDIDDAARTITFPGFRILPEGASSLGTNIASGKSVTLPVVASPTTYVLQYNTSSATLSATEIGSQAAPSATLLTVGVAYHNPATPRITLVGLPGVEQRHAGEETLAQIGADVAEARLGETTLMRGIIKANPLLISTDGEGVVIYPPEDGSTYGSITFPELQIVLAQDVSGGTIPAHTHEFTSSTRDRKVLLYDRTSGEFTVTAINDTPEDTGGADWVRIATWDHRMQAGYDYTRLVTAWGATLRCDHETGRAYETGGASGEEVTSARIDNSPANPEDAVSYGSLGERLDAGDQRSRDAITNLSVVQNEVSDLSELVANLLSRVEALEA